MAKADRIETFCNEIMNGKSQRQAYYAAYPSSRKWQDYVVDNKASELANSGEVLVRLQELRKQAEKDNQISRNDIINQLKVLGFADIEEDRLKPSDKIKALELMARMLGYDRPEPEESSGIIKELIEGLKGI